MHRLYVHTRAAVALGCTCTQGQRSRLAARAYMGSGHVWLYVHTKAAVTLGWAKLQAPCQWGLLRRQLCGRMIAHRLRRTWRFTVISHVAPQTHPLARTAVPAHPRTHPAQFAHDRHGLKRLHGLAGVAQLALARLEAGLQLTHP